MRTIRYRLCVLLLLAIPVLSYGQQPVFVNMAMLDGMALTPDNLLNFQVQSNLSKKTHALIKGSVRYRNSDMRMNYQFECDLQPGMNLMNAAGIKPRITYSANALKDLFEQYRMLPQGIYEYCVSVKPDYKSEESAADAVEECVYHKSEDIFLINLIDPDNNARIYEYNPLLSWTVNYPFAAELQYRLRVTEAREGQNNVTAISRNNPVYDERNLMQMSQVYPVYAKPLKKMQPYVWTVDAYYHGILLGGAEPWRFTIVDDSLLTGIPKDPSFVDIRLESGFYTLYAPGLLKLKYELKEQLSDSMTLVLLDKNGNNVKLKADTALEAKYGDNRFIINFYEQQPLRHLQHYTLELHSQTGKVYRVAFKYINPELIK